MAGRSVVASPLRYVPAAASLHVPLSRVAQVEQALLPSKRVLAITGAGLSTESGIPDYRSPQGSYSVGHKPMMHQEFVASEDSRKRYWARAVAASLSFREAQPNTGHLALAALEEAGLISGVITQNVDRLHRKAGSKKVLELHGHVDGVACLDCQKEASRHEFQAKIEQVNHEWFVRHMPTGGPIDLRADGDANVSTDDLDHFCVPGCTSCGGVLMPTIVFFGGNVPQQIREDSFRWVDDCDTVLVAGTSLKVWSSFRLIKAAHEQEKPIIIVNAGETRGDDLCTLKVDDVACGPLLSHVAESLLLQK